MAVTNEKSKRITYATWAFFAICLAGYTVIMYRLFYLQAVNCDTGLYPSDVRAYLLKIQRIDSGFDFPYPIYFWLGRFFLLFTNVAVASSLAATILNSLAVVILFYYMDKDLRECGRRTFFGEYTGVLALFMTYSMFFVSMLFMTNGQKFSGLPYRYLGVFTANPYHNTTYFATRPFAVLAFFLYGRILDYYEERTDVKEFILFGVSLLLTTLAKPSYTLVLVSAAGLLMLYRLFRSKWKTFRRAFYLGLTFVPTFVVLLYQFGGVFGGRSHAGAEGGIGIDPGLVWRHFALNIPLAIVLAMAFPLSVLIFHIKEIKKNTLYRFSWFQWLVSAIEFFLLYEKGSRIFHGNFSWGYMHGIFFTFVTSLLVLAGDTGKNEKVGKKLALVLQWIIFGLHLYCGVLVFFDIWHGKGY